MGKTITLTVVDKKTYPEFFAKYCIEGTDFAPVCDSFEIGETFTTDNPANRPEGFCAWAWDNIRLDIERLYNEVSIPWMKDSTTNITCCADGLRPVFFEIHLSKES